MAHTIMGIMDAQAAGEQKSMKIMAHAGEINGISVFWPDLGTRFRGGAGT